MKYVFIINPTAGKGVKQQPFADSVKKYFDMQGGDYEIYFTSAQGDAKKQARLLAESGEELRIYACGGEGTAFEVLNGVIGFDNVSLGVVPCGSANDFITYFSDRELFLDVPALVNGEELVIDVIKSGENYAINSCSVGMDAMVAANMSKFKRWPLVSGKMAYVIALVYTLFSKIGVNLKVTIDNGIKTIKRKALFAVVANAPYYGGGFYPTPDAKPFDCELDYSVVSVVSRPKIFSLLDEYRAGTHITKQDICEIGKAKNVVIEAEKQVPINMDGEIFWSQRAEFQIVEKAIKLILPKTISSVWRQKAKQEEPALVK